MDTVNKFMVGMLPDGDITLEPRAFFDLRGPFRFSKAEALTLAAWLVTLADPAGVDFPDILAAVQNT